MSNKREISKAVALFYDGKQAPQVTAKGSGAIADEIIAIAQAHQIPLCDNQALVDLLVNLELDQEIPENLYKAVAYIIAFAYALEGKTPDNFFGGADTAAT
jgi:flagellar biosynthesis protein